VQVEWGILKQLPAKSATEPNRLFILNIFLNPKSVKDGLAEAEQGENAGTLRPPALHLHIVNAWFFMYR
jgi:hypothetical protein